MNLKILKVSIECNRSSWLQNGLRSFFFLDNPMREKCFLPHLVKLSRETNAISRNKIVSEIVIMFSAGSETSAVTLTSALMFSGMNPDIQVKPLKFLFP